MSENTLTKQKVADDEWTRAMEEQNASTMESSDTNESGRSSDESEADTSTATDTEQPGSVSSEELTRSSAVFEQFSRNGVLNDTRNDIDMILDIPVQLTVELGRTKIAIKNL